MRTCTRPQHCTSRNSFFSEGSRAACIILCKAQIASTNNERPREQMQCKHIQERSLIGPPLDLSIKWIAYRPWKERMRHASNSPKIIWRRIYMHKTVNCQHFHVGNISWNFWPVRWLVSELISPADAGLLWEKNTVGWLISPGWNQQANRLSVVTLLYFTQIILLLWRCISRFFPKKTNFTFDKIFKKLYL